MEGDCHYLDGNINARRRVEYAQRLLEQIGLEGKRVKMINLSSAMGSQFASTVAEFTKEICQIGPNPLHNGDHESQTGNNGPTHNLRTVIGPQME